MKENKKSNTAIDSKNKNNKKKIIQKKKSEDESEAISLIPYSKKLDILTNNSKNYFILHLTIFTAITFILNTQINSSKPLTEKFRIAILLFEVFLTYISFIFLPNPKRYKNYSRIFFKLISSLTFVYFLNLCFMILLDNETLKYLLILIDPNLSEKIEERDYSQSCDFYTPDNKSSNFANVVDTLDIFIISHLFGWLGKSMIFRNHFMTWMMSVGFEVYEFSLKHLLPNFHECWWDHLFLDLFGCNLLGIFIGFVFMKKFNMRSYHWFYEPTEKTREMSYFKQFKYCFSNVEDFVKEKKWNFLASPINFLSVLSLLILSSVLDLSNFFNKSILNIPASHNLLIMRVNTIGFFSLLYSSEFYDYIRNNDIHKKIPFSIKLGLLITFSEILLFIKNVDMEFFAPACPLWIKIAWSFISLIILLMFIFSVYNKKRFTK